MIEIKRESDGTYTISGITSDTMIELDYALRDEAVLLSEYQHLEKITDLINEATHKEWENK